MQALPRDLQRHAGPQLPWLPESPRVRDTGCENPEDDPYTIS